MRFDMTIKIMGIEVINLLQLQDYTSAHTFYKHRISQGSRDYNRSLLIYISDSVSFTEITYVSLKLSISSTTLYLLQCRVKAIFTI